MTENRKHNDMTTRLLGIRPSSGPGKIQRETCQSRWYKPHPRGESGAENHCKSMEAATVGRRVLKMKKYGPSKFKKKTGQITQAFVALLLRVLNVSSYEIEQLRACHRKAPIRTYK